MCLILDARDSYIRGEKQQRTVALAGVDALDSWPSFREAAAQYGSEKSDDELRAKVLEIAAEHDVPQPAEGFTLKRENAHTIIDGSYTQPIEIFPGVSYPYTFVWHTDTFVDQAQKLNLGPPK